MSQMWVIVPGPSIVAIGKVVPAPMITDGTASSRVRGSRAAGPCALGGCGRRPWRRRRSRDWSIES